MIFFFGRIKDKIWSLRIFIHGILSKGVITLFQEIIASGKKLFSKSDILFQGIIMILTAVTRKFVFKIRRRLVNHNLMKQYNAPTPTTFR